MPRSGVLGGALVLVLAAAPLLAAPGALASDAEPEREPRDSIEAPTPVRILALGDSYTIGESVAVEARWPIQLANALRGRGHRVAAPQIIARTGWTSADLLEAIERSSLEPSYDLVTLLIGVNDQFQGFREAQYPERFQRLLDRALALAGGRAERVIVVSIPDYGVTPFGQRMNPRRIRAELTRYNDTNRDAAGRAGVVFVNVTPLSQRAEDDPSLVAHDGLHPSAKMYELWVERVLPLAERAMWGDTR